MTNPRPASQAQREVGVESMETKTAKREISLQELKVTKLSVAGRGNRVVLAGKKRFFDPEREKGLAVPVTVAVARLLTGSRSHRPQVSS
jgi:hypothetical protein